MSDASSEIKREMDAAADGMDKTVQDVAAEVKKDDPLPAVEQAVTGEGGSIPVVGDFERILGVPVLLMGFGLPPGTPSC